MKKNIFFLITILFSGIVNSQVTIIDTITSGGIQRDYRLYVPAAYDGSDAVPLVLNLHGYGSDNIGQDLYANFHPIADTANFLILMPNGTLDLTGQRYWNCFTAPGTGVDDVQFIDELLDSISAEYNVDQNRIYSTGMSNGGFMSHALACELSERITAIASVTGSIDKDRINYCDPQHIMPVMQIHGTADGIVPFNGSFDFLSVDSIINFWVEHNNCSETPTFTEIPDINIIDGCTAEHYVYGGCSKDVNVEFFKIIDGEHTWPGTLFFFLGVTNLDINACNEIWRFFSQYTLDGLTGINNSSPLKNKVYLYPNPATENIYLFAGDGIPVEIEINDLTGKTVFASKNTDSNNLLINIQNLSAGYYTLKYSDGTGFTTLPFIKK